MNWLTILNGIVPVFSLIVIGFLLKSNNFLPPNLWAPIERFAVYVLYPGFLIPAIWHADLNATAALPITGGVLGALLIAIIIAFSLRPVLKLSGPTFTSVFQGMMRFNSFIFIPVVSAIYGPQVMSIAAVAISFLIPTSNMVSILVLAKWGEPESGIKPDRSFKGMSLTLLTNPIFASCLLGLTLNLLHAPDVPMFSVTLTMLGQAAIPTGLIMAGAGLSFAYIAAEPKLVLFVSVFKTVALPILSWGICMLLGGDKLAQGVAVACGSAPCAAVAYVQARALGGDAPMMAGVVALTTILSGLSLPLLLWLFQLT
jgi:malonate transporter and related proteins